MSAFRPTRLPCLRALALASAALAFLARPLSAEEESLPTMSAPAPSPSAAASPDSADPSVRPAPPPPEVLALGPAAAPTAADSLLPATLGPVEKILWSENGIMRRLGMPLTEEGRENEILLRRNLLTAHQVGGFVTLAAMTATAITGQQIINGRDDLGERKEVLVTGTIISYFTTAALALVTPPPSLRRRQWNSISWHKTLAWIHFSGMIITPILGEQLEDDGDVELLHQVSGYATLAAFTGAMLVVTF